MDKEESLKKELPKGDLRGAIAELLRVVSLTGGELILLLPSLDKPYWTSFHFLERTFLRTRLRR